MLEASLSNPPRLASVADAMDRMLQARQHIALAVDGHGGTDRIVTLEHTIVTLIGQEIVYETDVVADLQKLAKQQKEHRAD